MYGERSVWQAEARAQPMEEVTSPVRDRPKGEKKESVLTMKRNGRIVEKDLTSYFGHRPIVAISAPNYDAGLG
ncbi:hypothetical protein ASF73_11130 [Xanthomonas sp. Leaf131]|nr:hypothetical protein ASF73_11130 [Xanthomonas sp. Leaf131]